MPPPEPTPIMLELSAARKPTPPTEPTPKPAKLVIPAKPAAVTAGNLGTLAATAAIVGGPPAWALLGATAAVGATVVTVRRRRDARRTSTGWTTRAGASRPRAAAVPGAASRWLGLPTAANRRATTAGRAGAPTRGAQPVAGARGGRGVVPRTSGTYRTPGSKPSPRPRAATGLGGGATGRTSATRPLSGTPGLSGTGRRRRVPGPQGRRLRRVFTAPIGVAALAGRTGRLAYRGMRAGWRKTAKPRRWVRRYGGTWAKVKALAACHKIAKLANKIGGRPCRWVRRYVGRGWAWVKRSPRRTWNAIKRAPRRLLRHLRSGFAQWIWQPARRSVRRLLGRKGPTAPLPPKFEPMVASKVDRPTHTARKDMTMAFKTPSAGGPLFQAARRFHATAAQHSVRGALEHREEAYDMAYAVAELAAGIAARVAKYNTDGIDPAYSKLVSSIAGSISAAAQSARRLGPSFDAIHETEIRRLLQPRPGEQKWDTTANGK